MQITVPDITVEQAERAMNAALASAYTADSQQDLEGANTAYALAAAARDAAKKV